MASQWDNFLCNLGEWRGTFTGIDADPIHTFMDACARGDSAAIAAWQKARK